MVEANTTKDKIRAYDFDVVKVWEYLREQFEKRVVVLDGGMGTQI